MASEKQVKGSLFKCFGDGIEPGAVMSVWAVYQLDETGALVRVHHACLSELEAKATKDLALVEGIAAVTVEQVTLITDTNYNGHIVGPIVEVMAPLEVTKAVMEKAKARLAPAELELLGLE